MVEQMFFLPFPVPAKPLFRGTTGFRQFNQSIQNFKKIVHSMPEK